MGVYLTLSVLPAKIGPADWARCYDDSLTLLQSHPLTLMRLSRASVGRTTRWVYTRQLEEVEDNRPSQRAWHVVGDIESLHRAESFRLYRQLPARGLEEEAPIDIAAALAREHLCASAPYIWTPFSAKTQGEPYHFPLLAVGMLVEHRFPGAAMISGDMDRAQCESVLPWAQEVLGHALSLPVVVSPERLYRRLGEHFHGPQLMESLLLLNRQSRREALIVVREAGELETLDAWFEQTLKTYQSPGQLGAIQLMVEWLNTTRDLPRLLHVACLDAQGPRFDPKDVLDVLISRGLLGGEDSELTALLTPAPGETDSPVAQLARFMFGAGVGSERIDEPIEFESLQPILETHFGHAAAPLRAHLREHLAAWQDERKQSNQAVRDWLKNREDETLQPFFDELLALQRIDELNEQRAWLVRCFAWSLSRLRKEMDARLLEMDADALLELVAIVSERQGLALREETWASIDALSELEELRFILVLMSLSTIAQNHAWLRRATLENPALRHDVYRHARDESLLEATRAWLSEHAPQILDGDA